MGGGGGIVSRGKPSVRLVGAAVVVEPAGLGAAGLGARVKFGGGALSGGTPLCVRLVGAFVALDKLRFGGEVLALGV